MGHAYASSLAARGASAKAPHACRASLECVKSLQPTHRLLWELGVIVSHGGEEGRQEGGPPHSQQHLLQNGVLGALVATIHHRMQQLHHLRGDQSARVGTHGICAEPGVVRYTVRAETGLRGRNTRGPPLLIPTAPDPIPTAQREIEGVRRVLSCHIQPAASPPRRCGPWPSPAAAPPAGARR
jgi:hypothetical protein